MKNLKDCFYFFLDKYKEQTGQEYRYFKNHAGIELLKIKRLGISYKEFMLFINYLYNKKKLSSLNFLSGQLNDYYSSKEYGAEKEFNELILHNDIMDLKEKTVGKCKKCGGTGYRRGKKCKCMVKFLTIRIKMRGQ